MLSPSLIHLGQSFANEIHPVLAKEHLIANEYRGRAEHATLDSFLGRCLERSFDFWILRQALDLGGIESAGAECAGRELRVVQVERVDPQRLEDAAKKLLQLLGVAQLDPCDRTHEEQGDDGEMRVALERDTIPTGMALVVHLRVASLDRDGRRRGVASGLKDAAEQHRPVDEVGGMTCAQTRQLCPRQVRRWTADVKEKLN